MTDPRYIRAEYLEERNAFISDAADWIEGRPSLEYRFILLDNADETPHWQGALEKSWVDEQGDEYSEIFAFAEYDHESAFDGLPTWMIFTPCLSPWTILMRSQAV